MISKQHIVNGTTKSQTFKIYSSVIIVPRLCGKFIYYYLDWNPWRMTGFYILQWIFVEDISSLGLRREKY